MHKNHSRMRGKNWKIPFYQWKYHSCQEIHSNLGKTLNEALLIILFMGQEKEVANGVKEESWRY